MKKFAVTTLFAGAVATAGLGLAGAAAATPTPGINAADTVMMLQDKGYNVAINGVVNAPLNKCRVTGVHGLNGTTLSMDELMKVVPTEFDTVYVGVSCPTHTS